MPTPPPSFLNWVPSGNPSYIQQPTVGQSTTGWVAGQAPPYEYVNWLFYTIDQWLMYLQATIAIFNASDLEANAVVLSTTGTVASGSNQLTALASTAGILKGQAIVGTDIPGGTYVAGLAGSTVTMSQNATGNNTGAVTFNHQYATGGFTQLQLDELDAQLFESQFATTTVLTTTGTLHGNTTLDGLVSTAGILPGQLITGANIPASTYVQSISGTTVTMTRAATGSGSETVTFGHGLAEGGTLQAQLDELDAYVQQGRVIGSVVATFPNLTGAYVCTATTAADGYGYVLCNGQTIADATSPMNGQTVPYVNNSMFLMGNASAGSTGGSASQTLGVTNLPSHTHGAGSYATSVGVALTGTTTFAASGHTHNFAHAHAWGSLTASPGFEYFSTNLTLDATSTSAATSYWMEMQNSAGTGAPTGAWTNTYFYAGATYTSGALGAPSGNGASATTGTESADASVGVTTTGSNSVTGTSSATGSGSSFNILPPYITAVYIMRIK